MKEVGTNIFSPEERARWIDIISKARNEGIYTPFSTKYFSIQMPAYVRYVERFGFERAAGASAQSRPGSV
jgi:hypothetical protein